MPGSQDEFGPADPSRTPIPIPCRSPNPTPRGPTLEYQQRLSGELVERYRRVVSVRGEAGRWHAQAAYPGPFVAAQRSLGPNDILGVLSHRGHIAIRARDDGLTDRIAFDVDCKAAVDVERRDRLYWAIRVVMGIHRVPLVYSTPSKLGLRVVYRIPEMPLVQMVTGHRTGLVADVLRAAGLPVRDGEIEIFPQTKQSDRLPLGRDMPILDPATLSPLATAAINGEYDEAMLRGGLAAMEAWHSAPYEDLLPHLQSLPGHPLTRLVAHEEMEAGEAFVRAGPRSEVKPSTATMRLVQHGLIARSTRYASEWLVGLAILLAPELFAEFGVTTSPNDECVARSLANWLAARHNGCSDEWYASSARRSTEAAVGVWTARYLERGAATGAHLVDRLRHVASQLDGSQRRTLLLSDAEQRATMDLAEGAGLSQAALYRGEVWLAACQRAVKSIVGYHARRGSALAERTEGGHRVIIVPIAARWMQRWPFGKGLHHDEAGVVTAGYVYNRQILIDAGLMQIERYSPTATVFERGGSVPDDLAYEATTYAVRLPELCVRVRDVGVDALELTATLADLRIATHGRLLGLDEAHHIIWVTRHAVSLRQRYGRRLGVRLQQIATVLEANLRLRVDCAGRAVKQRDDARQCTGPAATVGSAPGPDH